MTNTLQSAGASILTIRDLSVEASDESGPVEIVKNFSCTLRRGEVLGLVGESGAGKSTVGLAAMGYVRPGCRFSRGSVEFDGIDLLRATEEGKRRLRGTRIAYVAQNAMAAFNPAHRLLKQGVETATSHGVMTRQAAETELKSSYGRLHLPNPERFGRKFPHQASGGQLQRAMIAMAGCCRPELIVFDEPTTALDVTTQVEVLAAVRLAVQHYNTAAIYITHDLAVVAQLAHRIIVLRNGLAVEEAGTAEIMRNPKHEYTKTLWSVRKLQVPERLPEHPVLEVRSVTATYRDQVPVLHDVSLSVSRARTVALVGESGSGKSTLGRVIAGLLQARSGEILFEGARLPASHHDRNAELRRRIQLIPQSSDTSLNPHQTVLEIVGRPLRFFFGLRGDQLRRRTTELLGLVEMGKGFIDRRPPELSGGQKQRVSIARSLAADPSLVICDEITSALDQVVQGEILRLLTTLQNERQLSYLFITHDLDTVRAISDEVVVMQAGRIVDRGTRDEVFHGPHQEYTSLLLRSVPQMDTEWLTGILASRKAGATDKAEPAGSDLP